MRYIFTQAEQLFCNVTIKHRVLILMDKLWEPKPYYQYRPLFISDKVTKSLQPLRQGDE
jgi:hypothetical protein